MHDNPRHTAYMTEMLATRDHITGCGDVFKVEALLRQHYGKRYALCVTNATTAMLATALAADLRGSEIVASPFSWGGTLGALGLPGNSFVLAGVDPATLNLDPATLPSCLGSRTRAVVSTDQGGTAADHEAIAAFCKAYGLLYISDSACSLGAHDAKGRPAGSLADVVVVSFTQGKSVQAGEGAAILTDAPHIYERLLQVCQHPERQNKELGSFAANEFTPLNGRMHPMAAHMLQRTWSHQQERSQERQQRIGAWLARMSQRSIHTAPYSDVGVSTYFDVLLMFLGSTVPEVYRHAIAFAKPVTAKAPGPWPLDFRMPCSIASQLKAVEAVPFLRLNDLLQSTTGLGIAEHHART